MLKELIRMKTEAYKVLPHFFPTILQIKPSHLSPPFNLSSANAFNLDHSRISLLGEEFD